MKRKFALPWQRSKMDLFPPNQYRGWNAPQAKSRLVTPRPEPTPSLTPLKLLDAQPSATDADDRGITDLLIQGLLDRLPKPNAIWSLDDRAKVASHRRQHFRSCLQGERWRSPGDRRCLAQAGCRQCAGDGGDCPRLHRSGNNCPQTCAAQMPTLSRLRATDSRRRGSCPRGIGARHGISLCGRLVQRRLDASSIVLKLLAAGPPAARRSDRP